MKFLGAVHLVLSLALIYLVMVEAGLWTAIAIGLLMVHAEMLSFLVMKLRR